MKDSMASRVKDQPGGQVARRTEWLPIETAPQAEAGKAGPSFLAYENGMMAVGYFREMFGDAMFCVGHVGGSECEWDIEKPTHWMPLPDPPK